MPYRRNNSSAWWVSYTDTSGKRVRRSTGTKDRREAQALEAKWKLEAYRAQAWDEQPERTFDEMMLGFLKEVSAHKRDQQRDKYAAKHLYSFFTGRVLGGLSAMDVRAYIERRREQSTYRKCKVKPATINRELCLLSAAINHARREWEWDIPNPVNGRKLRESEGRVRWISRAEAAALLRAAEAEAQCEHLVDFIRLALHTGCRKGELLGLEWRRVDLQAGLIYLEAEHTKTARRRSVPLNREARAALMSRLRFRAEHCPSSPWVFARVYGKREGGPDKVGAVPIWDVKRSFHTACDRAGIENFRIHDLRHTCAAWLVSAGAALSEVRDLLGHTTVKMTERYAHLAPENVRTAVARLDHGKSHFGQSEDEVKMGAENPHP